MRSRSFAVASATLTLSLFAAACGDDETSVSEGTVTTPATSAAPSTTADGSAESAKGAPQGSTTPSGDTVTKLVSKDSDLASLKTALGAADLAVTLNQPGPYTVFAPNNDAFAKLGSKLDTLLQPASKDELANILKFHVVSGAILSRDLKDGELLTTVQGTRLRVDKKGDEVTVGNSLGKATVVSADSDASNGVVHTIDQVLTPKE